MVRDWIENRGNQDIQDQREAIDAELHQLSAFLKAAPRLEEEERITIPPPAEAQADFFLPRRQDFLVLQRQQYWHGIKLFFFTIVMVLVAVWVLNRIETYTNWLQ
ncbi:MAG: hypothetical protein AAF514_10230 [Verrucomicrobiota bacterium]